MMSATIFFSALVTTTFAVAAQPEARFSIKVNDKFGATDVTGKVVIEPQYDGELVFSDGLARVRVGGMVGFIDTAGKVVISPKATLSNGSGEFAQEVSLAGAITGEFSEGLALYRMDEKYGYVDRSGAVAIPAQFHEAGPFRDAAAMVREPKGDYGLIDRTGKFLIEPKYGRPFWFSDGLAAVLTRDKGYGYIDRSGRFVIEPQYNFAYNFVEGRARVQVKGRGYGYIDKSNKLVIEPPVDYKLSTDFSGGVAPVNVTGKGWGLIDLQGKFAVEPQFFSIREFSEGLAPVAVGDFNKHRWGYMDSKGKIVVPAEYDKAEPFSGGLGLVWMGDKGLGFVNAAGKLVIGPLTDYYNIELFKDGLARVWFSRVANERGVWGYIDTKGKLVWRGQ
jgi:hypothetical protein